MKCHNRQHAPGAKRTFGRLQPIHKRAHFVVHGNAQRLKAARGGVALARFGPRQTPFNQCNKLCRGRNRGGCTRARNGARDAPGGAFFAVVVKDVRQQRLWRGVDQICGAGPMVGHAHIQRAIAQKGKSALWLVQLHRGHAQIQHHAI